MSMTILKSTDVVAIKNSGNAFTAAQIMEYCENLGFTSFMLFAEQNGDYYILPCNPTKSNDNIYLFEDTSISVNGFHSTASASSAYHNKFVYSPSAGTLSDSNETPNMGYTYAQSTWGRRYYYDGSGSRPKACFYTTLSYDKIYLNQTDITPAPSYNWESISSITGKGKSYRLTDILNINDGLAMNDVQYDGNLDFSAKSKVNNMISEVVIDENAVAVEYKVPAGNYTYTKLVYKRNSIPNDVDDGTAINIDPALTKVSLTGIADGSVYWFVIFTDKSTSEPYKFGTEKAYIVNIDAKHGNIDLAGHQLLEPQASRVLCNGSYFYVDENTEDTAFYVVLNQKFTGDLDLWFETECYIGDADFPNDANSNSEYHFTLHGDNLSVQYQSRIWQITYRNAMFTHPVSGWLDYDYWYNNKIRNVASVMDDRDYANKWTKVAAKTEIRDGKITKLITYRNGEIYREDNESNYDISNTTFSYLSFDFPAPDSQHPIYNIYRAKYFKAWAEEVTNGS